MNTNMPVNIDITSEIYTIEKIKNLAIPIAQKYNLTRVYLFGSYARGEATNKSDIDLYIEFPPHCFKNISWGYLVFYAEIEKTLRKKVDIIAGPLNGINENFAKNISKDLVIIYGE